MDNVRKHMLHGLLRNSSDMNPHVHVEANKSSDIPPLQPTDQVCSMGTPARKKAGANDKAVPNSGRCHIAIIALGSPWTLHSAAASYWCQSRSSFVAAPADNRENRTA